MASRRRPPRSLPRGRHALDAAATAARQRERLQDAVVTLLCETGYEGMTVDAIAAQAHVSTASLYRLAHGKEELTLQTWEAIVTQSCAELRGERRAIPTELRPGLHGVLEALAGAVAARPQAARAVIVESLSVGGHGPALRRRLVTGLADLLRISATPSDDVPPISDVALAVLAGGTMQLLDQRLRSGRLGRLRADAQDLAAWGASYETAVPVPLPTPAPGGYGGGSRPRTPLALSLPRGRHGLPTVFVRRHQRGRIVDAVIALATEGGSESVTVRDVCARAQISHETYYSHFATREAALHAAYDGIFVDLFARTWYAAAEASDRAGAVTAAAEALTGYLAAEPELARFALNQARSGGAAAAEQTEQAHVAFARLISQLHDDGADGAPPALVPYALTGGIASLLAAWTTDGHATEIEDLAPQIAYAILAPYAGEQAARHATGIDAEADYGDAGSTGDTREQLIVAFAEAVDEDGYAATRLADVAQRSGIELDVAARIFADEADCAVHAVDAWARPIVLAAASAYLAAPADPPLAAHRALAAALRHLAEHPALTALALSEAPEVLGIQVAQRERYVRLFLELVAGAAPRRESPTPQPQIVLQMALEGIIAVVRQHLHERRLDRLLDDLPQLSRQVLVPFFGAAEADRVAALPAPEIGSRRPA